MILFLKSFSNVTNRLRVSLGRDNNAKPLDYYCLLGDRVKPKIYPYYPNNKQEKEERYEKAKWERVRANTRVVLKTGAENRETKRVYVQNVKQTDFCLIDGLNG